MPRHFYCLFISFLCFAVCSSAQRTLHVFSRDFDSAYCMHEVLRTNFGDEFAPVHYSQFYSEAQRLHPTLHSSCDSAGFLLHGLGAGGWSHYYCFSTDKKKVTVKYVSEAQRKPRPCFQDSCRKEVYIFDRANRLTDRLQYRRDGVTLLHKYTYGYDAKGRIELVRDSADNREWGCYYQSFTRSQFIERLMDGHKLWRRRMKEDSFVVDERLVNIYNEDTLRHLLSGCNTFFSQVQPGGSCNYVAAGRSIMFSFSVTLDARHQAFGIYNIALWKWNNGVPEQWFCHSDHQSGRHDYYQEVTVKEDGKWVVCFTRPNAYRAWRESMKGSKAAEMSPPPGPRGKMERVIINDED